MARDTIRNFCVIANVDAGKSTISDAFLCMGGLISEADAGIKRGTDTRQDEKERGITIKSTSVSIDVQHQDSFYNINLVDSPGHVDFSAEVTAAIRITDGALLVVDCVEGVCIQTEIVLRQALAEKVKPLLVINKIDRYFFELQVSPDEAYNRLRKIVDEVNVLIQTYDTHDETIASQSQEDEKKDTQASSHPLLLSPEKGNVIFVSGYHGWGFGLSTFSTLYGGQGKSSSSSLETMNMLWHGYVHPETKKASLKAKKGFTRAFSELVYRPLMKYIQATQDAESSTTTTTTTKSGLIFPLPVVAHDIKEKKRYMTIMKQVLPLSKILIDSIIQHLPNPIEAQKYRASILYPAENTTRQDIQNCDPEGQLVVYISKMIPTGSGGNFYALGRIFSGTLRSGQKVHVLGANYISASETKKEYYENKIVQKLLRAAGNKMFPIESASAGQIVALVGIDQWLLKSGTLLDPKTPDFLPIQTMKFNVNPVVTVSVAPAQASEMAKFVEGIKRLSKSDPSVKCYTTKDTKEQIVAGVGELHLEICLKDLQNFIPGTKIITSQQIVPLKETVTTMSPIGLAKSSNKLNRLWFTVEPLNPQLVQDIEEKNVLVHQLTGKTLVDKYQWTSTHDTKKIWSWAEENDTNVLVDMSKGVQYLNEIKESIISAFTELCFRGPLAHEPLRGVRVNLMDAHIHADSVHRSTLQISTATTNAILGSMLNAKPKLVEPYYNLQVQIPFIQSGIIYSTVASRRGRILHEEKIGTTPLCNMNGVIPVYESFGLDAHLKSETSGKAFLQLVVSQWETVDSSVLGEKMVQEVRARKKLKEDLPQPQDYLDKI